MNNKINLFFKKSYDELDKVELLSTIFTNMSVLKGLEEYKFLFDHYLYLLNKISGLDFVNNSKQVMYYVYKLILLNDDFEYYKKLFSICSCTVLVNNNLKLQSEIINKYFLASYNSSKNINEIYDKTLEKEIDSNGLLIIDLIKKINILSDKDKLFEYGQGLFELAANIRSVVTDDKSLSDLINYLNKGLIEGIDEKNNLFKDITENFNGKNCFYNLIGKDHCSIIDDIYNYRNYYDHTCDKCKDKVTKIKKLNKKIIDKNLPVKQNDFIKIQSYIYKELVIMLEKIIEKINYI